MSEVSSGGGTRVIRVTNVAPQATRDQMHTLFSNIGRIDDIRLYPSVRDASLSITSRVCFVKFSESNSASVGTHLNNTVFIDRAIIVIPVRDGLIPEEAEGLSSAHTNNNSKFSESKFPPNITNSYQGNLVFTGDTLLDAAGLPGYPPMPASTTSETLEELRRTVTVSYIDPSLSAQVCMEFFSKEAGEVKYFRYCTRGGGDPIKYALIEFSAQSSVIPALLMNDHVLGDNRIKVTHATTSIIKPTAKSNEDAQKEIEEALSRVKEAQSLVAATVDPLMGMLGGSTTSITGGGISSALARGSRSRSRSRRRSRSRGRSAYSSRRSRSRSRHRRRSRSRRRKRSRSRRRRSRSRERRSRSKERNGHEERRKSRSRSKSRERKRRSRSRSRKRSRSRSRKRSRSRSRERRRRSKSRKRKSRSRERRKRSKDRKSSRRSRSRSRSKKKEKRRSGSKEKSDTNGSSSKKENRISRDYDEEEMGYTEEDAKSAAAAPAKHEREENFGTQDMEISNSP